jgi:hypothetical protein
MQASNARSAPISQERLISTKSFISIQFGCLNAGDAGAKAFRDFSLEPKEN